jgi:hypothetical protein
MRMKSLDIYLPLSVLGNADVANIETRPHYLGFGLVWE